MAKKKKEEKQPNLKLSLFAAITFAVAMVFCVVDGLRTDMFSDNLISKAMLVFMALCCIGCLWLIVHIIQLIKKEKN